DQSQVQRYLTGESVAQSRIALLVNGIVKIPMQFCILFIGAILFVFYQFVAPPLFFNPVEAEKIKSSEYSAEYRILEEEYYSTFENRKKHLFKLSEELNSGSPQTAEALQNEIDISGNKISDLRTEAVELIQQNDPSANTNDTNYIFLTFVLNFLPAGLVGLVLAAIFSASMSSTSSEINSLASTTIVDVYKRIFKSNASERHYLFVSKSATVLWGLLAIIFAEFANHLGSLIEAVNILGSLFYGTILGIFLLAFYFKWIKGTSAFYAAIIAEACVIYCFVYTDISFLWYNVVGCAAVNLIAIALNPIFNW